MKTPFKNLRIYATHDLQKLSVATANRLNFVAFENMYYRGSMAHLTYLRNVRSLQRDTYQRPQRPIPPFPPLTPIFWPLCGPLGALPQPPRGLAGSWVAGQLGSWAAINPLDSLVRGVIFSIQIFPRYNFSYFMLKSFI
jgi:hypothetical protein